MGKEVDGQKFIQKVIDRWNTGRQSIEWENSYNLLRIANNMENISKTLDKIHECLKK